ncbi:MAG: hypothetical protein ACK2U9_16420, partial [Anaerolineae bacterium]
FVDFGKALEHSPDGKAYAVAHGSEGQKPAEWGNGDSIYLLYANGQIRKLSQGAPDAFDISDWDTPPRSPTALFTRPPDQVQWLYVADRGNSRIVQCSKEGQFKRQFRLLDSQLEAGQDPLADVSSLFVKEIDGHAFVLSGQSLYLLILPEEQG